MPVIDHTETIVGQYAKSEDGEKPAFKDEEDVPDDSRCVTFCAAIAHINNERWTDVPFILKAGKGLELAFSQAIYLPLYRLIMSQPCKNPKRKSSSISNLLPMQTSLEI